MMYPKLDLIIVFVCVLLYILKVTLEKLVSELQNV